MLGLGKAAAGAPIAQPAQFGAHPGMQPAGNVGPPGAPAGPMGAPMGARGGPAAQTVPPSRFLQQVQKCDMYLTDLLGELQRIHGLCHRASVLCVPLAQLCRSPLAYWSAPSPIPAPE